MLSSVANALDILHALNPVAIGGALFLLTCRGGARHWACARFSPLRLAVALGAAFLCAQCGTVLLYFAQPVLLGSACAAKPVQSLVTMHHLSLHSDVAAIIQSSVAASRVELALDVGVWRYFTALPCGDPASPTDDVCLVFKNFMQESWVGGLRSADGLRFEGEPFLLLHNDEEQLKPRQRGPTMTHNYALARVGDRYLLVGGQYKHRQPRLNETSGVWMGAADTLWTSSMGSSMGSAMAARAFKQPAVMAAVRSHWDGGALRHLFDGRVAGCQDRREPRFATLSWLRPGAPLANLAQHRICARAGGGATYCS